MLNFFPPYICKCGRPMGGKWGVKNGRWSELEPGCQPGCCLYEVDANSKRR